MKDALKGKSLKTGKAKTTAGDTPRESRYQNGVNAIGLAHRMRNTGQGKSIPANPARPISKARKSK